MLFCVENEVFTDGVAKKIILHKKVPLYSSLLNFMEISLVQMGYIIQEGACDENTKVKSELLVPLAQPFYKFYIKESDRCEIESWSKSHTIQAHLFLFDFVKKLEMVGFSITCATGDNEYYDDVADNEAALISEFNSGVADNEGEGKRQYFKP
ncbi:hypothetical protein SJI19_16755 [Acerihabitans sp. TG2]|uniref:hypothetical protein n=1 Tax=Acerihabitans sp. TG2 TaxID=3096008 RepID=UPI002B2299AD|nr:hypothetical protein [Acerihabitans sp. TG2]MEA9392176.1 hypothetical protein [Acerihabitans sp. TG2]